VAFCSSEPASQQRLDGTVGQQRAQREAEVGGVDDLAASRAYGLGQALAAVGHRMLQALPAAFGVLAPRVLEAGRGEDLAILPVRGRLVAFEVQRGDDVLIELGALVQHGLGRLDAVISKVGDLLGQGRQACQLLHVEDHVLDGGAVAH